MAKKPHILITNDDGIHAAGIYHLWHMLHDIAHLTVIAPLAEQSAVGLSITIRAPLKITPLHWPDQQQVWAINGTPADCVKLGLHAIMQQVPDLVVSGINRGSNAGRNLLYSGTVGGATEGVMHDIPSIAFSCCDFEDPDYLGAADHVRQIVNYAIDHRLAHGTLLNVNFPSKHGPRNQGCRMTRQGKEMWVEDPDQRYHPTEGHHYYWLGAKLLECDEHEDSDISWLRKGYTTAVPIHVCELTDHRVLATHKSIFETTTNTEELQPRSR